VVCLDFLETTVDPDPWEFPVAVAPLVSLVLWVPLDPWAKLVSPEPTDLKVNPEHPDTQAAVV